MIMNNHPFSAHTIDGLEKRSFLRTKSEELGNAIPCKHLRVLRMCKASLLFEDQNTNEVYFATRKVANKILDGVVNEVLFIDRTVVLPDGQEMNQRWLAIPSIF
jgi:hypothetical protein